MRFAHPAWRICLPGNTSDTGVVADWCREAASRAGEHCAVSFERLARVLVAGIDGLILQHVVNPDPARSEEDLESLTAMLIALAAVEPAG